VDGYGALNFRQSGGSGSSSGTGRFRRLHSNLSGSHRRLDRFSGDRLVASGTLGGAVPNLTLGNAANTEPTSLAVRP